MSPLRNVVFNHTGISFCIKTPVVHEKGLVFVATAHARVATMLSVTQRQNDCACFKSLARFPREKEWAP